MFRHTQRLILLLALALRALPLFYGFPFAIGYFDELFSVRNAVSFGVTKSLYPALFCYPALHSYILFLVYGIFFALGLIFKAFHNIPEFALLYLTKPGVFYVLGRLVSVALGTATVYLVYKVLYRLSGKRNVALLGELLLALSPLHHRLSHYATVDVTMLFFVTAALYFLLRAAKEANFRYLLFSSFLAGLAIATKFNAALIIAPIALSCFLIPASLRKRINYLLVAVSLLLAGLFLGSPFCILDFDAYYRVLTHETSPMVRFGELGNSGTMPWVWIIKQMLFSEMGIGIVFILGLIHAVFNLRRRHNLLLLSIILLSFFYIGRWSKESLHYLIAIWSAQVIISAGFLDDIYTRLGKKKVFAIAGLFLIFVPPLIKVAGDDFGLLLKDTRVVAKEWIEENIPPGTKVALYTVRYKDCPPIVSYGSDFSSLDYGPKARGAYQDIRLNTLLNDYFSRNRTYRIYRLEKDGGWKDISELKNEGIEYVILPSYLYERYAESKAPKPGHRLYAEFMRDKDYFSGLMREAQLTKAFKPSNNAGPAIKIYRIK